jgi:Zn-finger nucleic acid-binding protein
MRDVVRHLLDGTRRVGSALLDPLRKQPDGAGFTLSIPETHTTTVDGGIGWADRPAAVLGCPQCETHIQQTAPYDEIDCPRCTATFEYTEFTELELLSLICPVCGDTMEHGRRHPEVLDVPEWATCHSCRYHWEFKHSFP